MAAYENEGYCPSNDFVQFFIDNKDAVTPVRDKTMKILGKRTAFMVYEKNKCAWRTSGYSSIVDAMLNTEGFLGMEIACLLRTLIPDVTESTPAEMWPKFLIVDHVNPHDICDGLYWSDDEKRWQFFVNGLANRNDPVMYLDGKMILYDDRYLVVVDDSDVEDESLVRIDLFRMPE